MLKKLKAFTIIELIMSLLISSVVIGIVFYVYLLFSKQFLRYQDKSMLVNEYLLFQKTMQHDLDEAAFVHQPSPASITCQADEPASHIEYSFLDTMIVRNNGQGTDTFRIKNNIAQINQVDIQQSNSPVNKIVLHILIGSDMFDVIFTKLYSADQSLKQVNTHE